jgi:dihydropyrimidinase
VAFDRIITGGELVTAGGTRRADLGIAGGKIAAVEKDLSTAEAAARTDASGRLVLPGAVDPHVHLDMDAGGFRSSDDFETGTIAAACGGTTTIIDFIEPDLGGSLQAGFEARLAEARGRAVIDFGLHMTLRRGDRQTLDQVPEALQAGCASFKTYTTYDGFRLTDYELLAALEAVGAAGGLVLVHAESDAIVARGRARFMAAGQTGPRYHPLSRPPAAEGEAIERALSLAEVAGCRLYIVHTSTGRGADAMARARARGQAAYGETCPQYLVLDDRMFDRPGFEGAKFVCSPPLRPPDNPPALWRHLASGGLQTVGTDHCPFYYQGQKELGREAFTAIPNGMPGIEARLALLYTFGVGAGRLSRSRWVEVCCTAPAQIFGLYPRKGTLEPGADADIVIFDPEREVVLSTAVLHERVDYTPYEGLALKGYPVMTLAGGEIIAADGRYVGGRGRGRYLARKPG